MEGVVDTPFLTVLKTWTSPFKHSVIILVCVRFEFPEVSATRALFQDLSTRLFCVWFCTKHLCFCFGGQGMACLPSPHSTGHGLRPPAVFCCHRPNVWPTSTLDGRPAIYFGQIAFLACRPLFICFCRYFYASCASWHTLCSPPYTMEGSSSWLACLESFARGIVYKREPLIPPLGLQKFSEELWD